MINSFSWPTLNEAIKVFPPRHFIQYCKMSLSLGEIPQSGAEEMAQWGEILTAQARTWVRGPRPHVKDVYMDQHL